MSVFNNLFIAIHPEPASVTKWEKIVCATFEGNLITLAYLLCWRENSAIFGALWAAWLVSSTVLATCTYVFALICTVSYIAIGWYIFCKHVTRTNMVGWLTVQLYQLDAYLCCIRVNADTTRQTAFMVFSPSGSKFLGSPLPHWCPVYSPLWSLCQPKQGGVCLLEEVSQWCWSGWVSDPHEYNYVALVKISGLPTYKDNYMCDCMAMNKLHYMCGSPM